MAHVSKALEVEDCTVLVKWSKDGPVNFQVRDAAKSRKVALRPRETCELAAILLSACRSVEGQTPDEKPDGELLALADRLRNDQSQLTPTDLAVAAGYLELLLQLVGDNKSD
jgi:hypothetical protein